MNEINAGMLDGLGTSRPILFPLNSVNHKAPSGPVVMPPGRLLAVGIGYSVMAPAVVIRPIWLTEGSVNQRAPSGPVVMKKAPEFAVGIGYSVNAPAVVIRPILFPGRSGALRPSVNQSAPSGPAVIP